MSPVSSLSSVRGRIPEALSALSTEPCDDPAPDSAGKRNVTYGASRSRFSGDRCAEAPAAGLFPVVPCRELPKLRPRRRYADFSGTLHCSFVAPPDGG